MWSKFLDLFYNGISSRLLIASGEVEETCIIGIFDLPVSHSHIFIFYLKIYYDNSSDEALMMSNFIDFIKWKLLFWNEGYVRRTAWVINIIQRQAKHSIF